ncbi:MmgE/PrpD family protein [Salinibacterium sp. GXW1014]|uniref:MmgE/PrpD family protein n=1 Tax=Salinibacterium sp. GXW1014 TaxID=3377838 RepID=UPI00383B702A
MSTLSAELVGITSALTYADLQPDVRRAATLSLLDGLGVSLAATSEPGGPRRFTELVLDEGGRQDATVFGTGKRVPAASAAFANGALSHALDFEDSIDNLPIHPNAQSIPALLAVAEQRGISGERLICAMAIACDVSGRLAQAAGTAIGDRGWYPPPILGALGATVGASNLLGLSAAQTLDALSLAISQSTASGEVKHSPHSVVRAVRDGFASHVAVRSVELAERGITGFDAPLEGKKGFFATFAGGEYEREALLRGLGSSFWGTQVSFKPWPSCRGTHSFVEGALDLREQAPLLDIDRVELLGAPVNIMLAEPIDSKRRPSEAIDAKFSLPFTVASALVHGDVTFDSYTPAALSDPEVLALADRIDFVPDPAKARDESMTHGEITVILRDGRRLHKDIPTPRGNPTSPLGMAGLREKFVECVTRSITAPGAERAGALADRILSIADAENLREELPSILTP